MQFESIFCCVFAELSMDQTDMKSLIHEFRATDANYRYRGEIAERLRRQSLK